MSLADYGVYPDVDQLMQDIERFDLYEHVVELQAYGLTIVPPEKMQLADDFVERLRDAILRTCEKRNGIQLGDHTTAASPPATLRNNSWDLLAEDPVFVEAAINPVNLTLVRWLLGQSAVFSGQTWILKGQGGQGLGLHSDAHGIPPGAGQLAHMCNASWLCTDYNSEADGPTVFVPGSQHYGRATLPHEAKLSDTPFKFVPLIAKAGALAIWHGGTWHASLPRTNPGLRVTLVQNYMRSYMRVQRDYSVHTPPELLAQHPDLARIVGQPLYPYEDAQNPSPERIAPFMRSGVDPFA